MSRIAFFLVVLYDVFMINVYRFFVCKMIATLLNKYLILLCIYCYRYYTLTGCYGGTSLLQAGFITKIFIIINVIYIYNLDTFFDKKIFITKNVSQ